MAEDVQSLTEEQEKLLMKISVNEKRVQEGELYSWQEEVLRQFDIAKAYLKRKYPSHSFTIVDCTPKNKINEFTTFWFISDDDDEEQLWRLRLDISEDGVCSGRDDFYGAILAPEYAAALLQRIQTRVPECILAKSVMQTLQGEEFGESLHAESLLDKTVQVTNTTTLYVDGGNDAEMLVERVHEALLEMGIYGAYTVIAVDGTSEDGVTIKDVGSMEAIYRIDFNIFDAQEAQ